MLGELLEKCEEAKREFLKEAGIAENDAEILNVIVEDEYPFGIEINYKITNNEGHIIYLTKNREGVIYDILIEELLKCKSIDEQTKKILKKHLEEWEKKWDEYIRDP